MIFLFSFLFGIFELGFYLSSMYSCIVFFFQVRSNLAQLEYGNKISILSGDYLLANACTGLASLR